MKTYRLRLKYINNPPMVKANIVIARNNLEYGVCIEIKHIIHDLQVIFKCIICFEEALIQEVSEVNNYFRLIQTHCCLKSLLH